MPTSVPPAVYTNDISPVYNNDNRGGGGWGGYHVHVSEKHVAVKMFDYI